MYTDPLLFMTTMAFIACNSINILNFVTNQTCGFLSGIMVSHFFKYYGGCSKDVEDMAKTYLDVGQVLEAEDKIN